MTSLAGGDAASVSGGSRAGKGSWQLAVRPNWGQPGRRLQRPVGLTAQVKQLFGQLLQLEPFV